MLTKSDILISSNTHPFKSVLPSLNKTPFLIFFLIIQLIFIYSVITTIQLCNSKASYLPRQSLEKQASSDPDHGSYKLTLHSNEDLVGSTTKSTYDILAQQSTKLPPNNLPDVLPLGAKLQPSSNNSINSQASLRYGSNNNISNSSSSSQSSPTQSQAPVANCYPAYPPSQQRYSTPVLNSFNLNNTNYSRSQSYDTNASNHNVAKYMTQSSLDLKKPSLGMSLNLEATIEEHPSNMLMESREPSLKDQQQNSSLSSLSSLSESCASHEERLNGSGGSLNNNSVHLESSIAPPSLFRAELVNTTFAGGNANSKKSVTRQESLRENIEKITQLQSQLMSAHISDSGLMMGHGYTSSLSPHTNSNRTSQANVIDIPKTLELEEEPMDTNDDYHDDDDDETTPPPSATPPPPPTTTSPLETPACVEEEVLVMKKTSYTTNTASPIKPPKEVERQDFESATAEHILSQLDSSTDGLKLVQRSEIILRVNPSTVETASQTDDITDSELKSLTDASNSNSKEAETANRATTLQPRQRLPIEDECEKLSKELAPLLQSNDALVQLLCPPGNKTVQDYVSNLYNPNVHQRPSKRDVGTSTLTRNSQHQHHTKNKEEEKITVELKLTEVEIAPDSCDILKSKVDELIKYLNNKVRILSKEQAALDEESAVNDDLGNALLDQLCDKVKPIEESKCRTYIADVGHITGLLLSLSERLARAENQLTAVGDNNTEKKSLENKRDRLHEQLTEAKRLKADIDRRGLSVKTLLEKNLSADEYADFDYFINMKAKLITDARDIADKIKMGEEIITALSDTLIQSDC
uniref:ASD2 domain-containing protein n=1 Tax=Stomoxys calcitrans TaxID=35570 RepID=A0A1I8P872_STOCA